MAEEVLEVAVLVTARLWLTPRETLVGMEKKRVLGKMGGKLM
jgi:hypothetical protein